MINNEKLRYIDSLRGIAILLVMVVHCGQLGSGYSHMWEWLPRIISMGQYGVQLFYITSALTLFLSFKTRKSRENKLKINFFIRRFFRIAPMYYIGIFYFFFERTGYFHFISSENLITISNAGLISNFLFIHSLNPQWINMCVSGGWSISVEMIFYLFVPVLFSKVDTLNKAIILLLSSLGLSFILNVILCNDPYWAFEDFLYYYFPNQLPVFAIGIVAYFLVFNENNKLSPDTILLLFVFSLFYCYHPLPIHIKLSLAFLLLILLLSKNENKLFVNKFTVYIGKISYSMYLIHFAILHILRDNFADYVVADSPYSSAFNYAIRYALILLFTVAVSSITYKYIEVPFQNVGKRLIDRISS